MSNTKEKELTTFEKLSAINVNDKVEQKNKLTYLSWAWAWSEVKKACPDATYVIGETEYDEDLGFMCHTEVTIEGETLEMWLPVMDGANKSMKKTAYKYTTRYGDKDVAGATTFDINKTLMRCLVKNLAMFGLGIYIYAGEDMPESNEEVLVTAPKVAKTHALEIGTDDWKRVLTYISANKEMGLDKIVAQLGKKYTVDTKVKAEIKKQIK
jgi:hypothetical protein